VLVQYQKLGNENGRIANVSGFSKELSRRIHRSEVRQGIWAATAGCTTCVGFFVDRHNIRREFFLCQKVTGRTLLDCTAVVVFGAQCIRWESRVVDESGLPGSGGLAEAPLEEGRLLVDPPADAREFEEVPVGTAIVSQLVVGRI